MHIPTKFQDRLNVLISSSRQWNPGDEFILLGVRRLLESVSGASLNYILWNRNPDLFLNRWQDAHFRPDFLTNSAREPSLDLMDLVVLAGTPEWYGQPVERIFREMLRYPKVPLLAIGIGGAGQGFTFSALEREIFQREHSCIICRNPVLTEEINEQLGSIRAITLPCPAFFSSPEWESRPVESFEQTRPALTVQSDGVINQSAPLPFVEALIDYLNQTSPEATPCLVSHYLDEFLRFSRLKPDAYHYYSYEAMDFVSFYREGIRGLMASRLHGGIASLSCGTPACLVDFGSDRVNDAARPFVGLLPYLEFSDAIHWLDQLTPDQCAERSQAILAFKDETFRRYRETLEPFLARYVRRVASFKGG